MDGTFLKNFIALIIILMVYVCGLAYILIAGDKEISRTDQAVSRTHNIIAESQDMSVLIESLLSAHRSYIGTRDPQFQEAYEARRASLFARLDKLRQQSGDNPAHVKRLDEIEANAKAFDTMLVDRVQRLKNIPVNPAYSKDIKPIEDLKNTLVGQNNTLLENQYQLLNARIASLERSKDRYFSTLFLSGAAGAVLLLVFNTFLFHAHSRRAKAEAYWRETEERLALAIEGTNDGIFDWDLKTGKVFFSRQYFALLGYQRPAFIGTVDDTKNMIHPDDERMVWENVNGYLNGTLSEYTSTYRMRHASGKWLWIHARGKALFDQAGVATRLVGAVSDITFMREYQERLKIDKQQADRANRAKSEFLAHMSHEIRTPLTAISGIAEIFERSKDNLNEKQQRLIKTLYSSTAALKDLINDILDFSKIESGELQLEYKAFSLTEMLDQIVAMMQVMARQKGLQFACDYSAISENDEFYGDVLRVRQIMVNLIGNAIKFTDSGSVSITVSETGIDPNMLQIAVTDTGIGIAKDKHRLVFERFKQGDSSVSRKFGGTGLGLPISKNLARLMRGDILLTSAPDQGSTFTLILPWIRNAGEHSQMPSKLVRDEAPDPAYFASHSDRVLLVEDYEGSIVVISYILEDMNLAYDVAHTGREALEMWETGQYNLILMDIQMPEMDGFTATQELRQREKERNLIPVPILGMTAHAQVNDIARFEQAGMNAYLPKPIVETDLKNQIIRLLRPAERNAA